MTENLAGRGEGLAGLAEAIKLAISAGADLRYDEYGVMEMPIGHLATKWDMAQAELQRILAALEAAAPASTARRSKLELSIAEECLKPAIDLLNDAIWNYRETVTIKRGDLNYAVELAREALATPSPQAPQEQSKVFSTTSAREQSLATAASGLSVGYSEDSPFSINRLALAHSSFLNNVPVITVTDGAPPNASPPSWHDEPAATQEQPAGSGATPQVIADLQIALRIVGDWKEDSRGLVHVHKDVIRKAIVAALRSAGNCGSPRKVGEDAQSATETMIRMFLWGGHGHEGIYGDDGEMQCGECSVDYKRDSLDICVEKARVAALQTGLAKLARPSSVPVGEQK